MTGSQRVPVPAQHVAVSYLDGEAVLYDAHLIRPVLLNSTAAMVWTALDGMRTVAEVATELAVQFGAEPQQVAADVAVAIASFDELGLLAKSTADRSP